MTAAEIARKLEEQRARNKSLATKYSAAGQGYAKTNGNVTFKGESLATREPTPRLGYHSPDQAYDPRTNEQFLRDRVSLYQRHAAETPQDQEDRLFREGQGIAARAGLSNPALQARAEMDAGMLPQPVTEPYDATATAPKRIMDTFDAADQQVAMGQIGPPMKRPDDMTSQVAGTGEEAAAPEVGAPTGETIDPLVAALGDERVGNALRLRAALEQVKAAQPTGGKDQPQSELAQGLMRDAGEFADQMKPEIRALDTAKTVDQQLTVLKNASAKLAKLREHRDKAQAEKAEADRDYQLKQEKFKLDQKTAEAETARAERAYRDKQSAQTKAALVESIKTQKAQVDAELKNIREYVRRAEAMGTVTSGLYGEAQRIVQRQQELTKKLADAQKGIIGSLQGDTLENPLPMPESRESLIVGKCYQTPSGPLRWIGQGFVRQ